MLNRISCPGVKPHFGAMFARTHIGNQDKILQTSQDLSNDPNFYAEWIIVNDGLTANEKTTGFYIEALNIDEGTLDVFKRLSKERKLAEKLRNEGFIVDEDIYNEKEVFKENPAYYLDFLFKK